MRSAITSLPRTQQKSRANLLTDGCSSGACPDELLNEAYNRCVDNTGKVNMKYINAILESWHNAGIHTLKEAVDERIAAEARREGAHKPSYDLDEYEKYDIFATEK